MSPSRPTLLAPPESEVAVPVATVPAAQPLRARAALHGPDRVREEGVPERRRQCLRRFVLSLSPQAWGGLDMIIIAAAVSAAHCGLVEVTGYVWLPSPLLTIPTYCLAFLVAALVFGLYERRTLLERSRILLRCTLALTLGVTLALAFLGLVLYESISRWLALLVAAGYVTVAVPLRLYAHVAITSRRVRVLCVGGGPSIQQLVQTLRHLHHRHYQVVGRVEPVEGVRRLVAGAVGCAALPQFRSREELDFDAACPKLGLLPALRGLLRQHGVDDVVVGAELTHHAQTGPVVSTCLEEQRRVTDPATFVEKLLGEVPADSVATGWFLSADLQQRASYDGAKRVLDVAASLAGLLVTLPVWPLIALAVRLTSPGPVLFRQVRVGQHGRLFTIYKFRTMRADAEKDGAQWARANDQRVTRVGRVLRRSRLDELPQLLNILRGDMSLVGPRPERPEFVRELEQLIPHYRLRHVIKPGLTGWAQIHYGYGASVADAHRKLCFDLYYLKHRSIDLDLSILIRTVGTFVLGAR